MKFIRSSLSYLSKNFVYVGLLSLIPAVFMGLLLEPFKIVEFANTYSSTPVLNFNTIFGSILNFSVLTLVVWVVAFILLAIFLSAIMGQMESHMRSGKHNFSSIKEYVNNNIVTLISNLLTLLVIAIVLMFLTSSILFLLHLILSGINTSPTVTNYVISNILLVAIFILYSIIGATFFLNIANMISGGYPFRHSLSNTFRLIQKNALKLGLAVLFPFIFVVILVSAFITLPGAMVYVNVICTWALIMYYSALAMTSYFKLSGTKRYDNTKKYYYK